MKNTQIEALFVDRDGTLIEDKHYLSDPASVCLLPHVAESLKKIHEQGIKIFIVTNQSGIGRGYFTEKEFFACQAELEKQLNAFGVVITESAFCPHNPIISNDFSTTSDTNVSSDSHNSSENCHCRKPNIGMWEQLSTKHGLIASKCAMIGDKKADVGFGLNAGFALSCLVATGKGRDSAEKLGISFAGKVQAFLPSVISDVAPINIHSQCISAQNFEDFTEFLLEKG